MKNKRNVLFSMFIILAGVINSPVHAQQKEGDHPVTYQLDVKKSKLFWKALNNKHNGFILFNSGILSNVTTGWPTQGTFSINMNSMKSIEATTTAGRKEVDDKLRSEDFFAVSKYPAATMVINKIVPEPNSASFKVYGELTIKNITKPVEFTTIMKQNGNIITATATTNISRANWNIDHKPDASSWNLLAHLQDKLVDDDIPINLELVFANREITNRPSKKLPPKPLSAAEMKAGLKKWEASPDGIKYKKWEASTEGKKVNASADKIRKYITTYTNMEAVVISLSRKPGSPGDYCVLVRINGDDYLLNNNPQDLQGLKVNDKIIIRSHSAGCAPKYPYLIVWGDYIERDGKIIYKRAPNNGGC